MVRSLHVLALTRYGRLAASSRLRFVQYFPALQAAGIQVRWQALIDDNMLQTKYRRGKYGPCEVLGAYKRRIVALLRRHEFDVLWIEKESLPWCPLWLEAALLKGMPFLLDYDDAVFHKYDTHRLALIRRIYGDRLDRLMAKAALVVCGNTYLAKRAQAAGAIHVKQLPTVIDLERYKQANNLTRNVDADRFRPRIVWIGTPCTVEYLQLVSRPLQVLAQKKKFILRVIGASLQLPDVQVECVPWSEATEVDAIAECDIGIMPLFDTPWERGKCGYKLIQYMACGLPVVASDIGVNSEIVQDGVNGFLARNDCDWLQALTRLLHDADLRRRFGESGRKRVEEVYCIQKTGPVMAKWLFEVAGNNA